MYLLVLYVFMCGPVVFAYMYGYCVCFVFVFCLVCVIALSLVGMATGIMLFWGLFLGVA